MIIDVVTNIPTPYNQHFFRSVSERADLLVHYMSASSRVRSWLGHFTDGHQSVVYDGHHVRRFGWWNPELVKKGTRPSADFTIISGGYLDPTVSALISRRRGVGGWAFWGEPLQPGGVVLNAVRRSILSRFDLIVAIGTRSASTYSSLTAGPIHVLPYTTLPSSHWALGTSQACGYVGQLVQRKGVDVLIRALAGAPGVCLDVVGAGPALTSLKSLASELRVSVRWIGEQPNDEVAQIAASWAAQIVPSRYDGWGVVVNEALAAARPVVVTTATGASELVDPGKSGWIVDTGRVASLRDGLTQAVASGCDRSVRERAGTMGTAIGCHRAADFLLEVLADPSQPRRSFVGEAHRETRRLLEVGRSPNGDAA